jgi:hypothetical protein
MNKDSYSFCPAGRKSFLVLSVSASEITDFFYPEIDFVTTSDDKPIAPTSITAGEFGSLGGDGLAVRAYGDGETHVATPSIPSCKYYRCQVFVTKHFLRSSVSCQALSNPEADAADTHSLSGWTDQVHTLGSDGTMAVNKLGHSVTRHTKQSVISKCAFYPTEHNRRSVSFGLVQ